MSAGASVAITDGEVGTQSISPITNTKITSSTTGTAELAERSRNGRPISSIAEPSFAAGEMPETRRVKRSWKNVTIAGLRTTRKPQVEGEIPCESTSETGSTI